MMEPMNNTVKQLRTWSGTLKEVAEMYPGRTIENIIANIEARIKVLEHAHKRSN